jgi:hypothetical protein
LIGTVTDELEKGTVGNVGKRCKKGKIAFFFGRSYMTVHCRKITGTS